METGASRTKPDSELRHVDVAKRKEVWNVQIWGTFVHQMGWNVQKSKLWTAPVCRWVRTSLPADSQATPVDLRMFQHGKPVAAVLSSGPKPKCSWSPFKFLTTTLRRTFSNSLATASIRLMELLEECSVRSPPARLQYVRGASAFLCW
jgi:hypothetical protein